LSPSLGLERAVCHLSVAVSAKCAVTAAAAVAAAAVPRIGYVTFHALTRTTLAQTFFNASGKFIYV